MNIALKELFDLAKINPNKELPLLDNLERRLERLIAEQERLGGVNLLAEQEAKETVESDAQSKLAQME